MSRGILFQYNWVIETVIIMKNKKIILILFVVIFAYLSVSLSLINRQIVENDEGIYWATFLLVNKGYSLYKEISFSQLPGFFLAVYPIFKLFESTIAAARFGVLFWSTLALLSIVWLGYVRKNLFFSFISVILLISIPTFFNQSITLQSDMVAVSFSTISFVFMMVFINYSSRLDSNYKCHYLLLILSSLFFSFAMLTKLDYSLVLPFGFILLTQKKQRIFNIFLFLLSSIFIILATLNFFGINTVINNVLTLREKALLVYPFEPFKVLEYLQKDILLFTLILANFFYALLRWRKELIFTSLFLWLISSLFLVFSFRSLFQHHLVFLAVPSALLFASNLFNMNASINRLIEAKVIILLIISVVAFVNNVFQLAKRQNSKSIKEREIAKNFILENTESSGVIVSDEAALYGMTGRLPPPELVDISYVQIKSENISTEKFQSAIKKYKPKLIIAWNGRVNTLRGFEESLTHYKKISYSNEKKIFIRENFYKN